MKSLFRRARSTSDFLPKYAPSPLTSLPEDVLIAALGYVDVPDIIRLRRVNKSFRDLTKSLIVWVHALQRFSLILHHQPNVTSALEIEDALVFSTRLDKKLSSTKLSTRSGWILSEAVGGELWTPSMSIAGDYLVVSGSENGFLCVNLATRIPWNIPVPGYPVAHWVTAMEMTLKGERGMVVVGRGLERIREAIVYFQPLPELPNDERARELIRIGTQGKISSTNLCGSSVLIGSASGEITRVDLEHMITQKYSIGGHVWDLAIYEQFLVICHTSTGSRITILVLSPLDNIADTGSDWSSSQVTTVLSSVHSTSREVFAVSLPKHAFLPRSTTNPVIRMFTHSVPLVSLGHSLIIPYRNSSNRVDAVYSNIPGTAFPPAGLLPGSPWAVSCLRAGHSRALSLISPRTGNVNNQELILSDVQDASSIVHRRVNIHSKKLAECLLGRASELAWDEPSGRLCVCTRRPRQKCIITVLEF